MGYGIDPDYGDRVRTVQAENIARAGNEWREEQNRLNRPVWRNVNRLELIIIAGVILGLVLAGIVYWAVA
jgi:hypothetical protein